jgi:hypothetical protein
MYLVPLLQAYTTLQIENYIKTLRYKYLVLSAQMEKDGTDTILRISVQNRKVRSKLSYLLDRIKSDIPLIDPNCSAVGIT